MVSWLRTLFCSWRLSSAGAEALSGLVVGVLKGMVALAAERRLALSPLLAAASIRCVSAVATLRQVAGGAAVAVMAACSLLLVSLRCWALGLLSLRRLLRWLLLRA